MVQFSSLFEGLARSVSFKGSSVKKDMGREAADTLADETPIRCKNMSVFSKRGEKGLNQDRLTVWEKFGHQQNTTFCGVYDGHGPWGHFVAKWVSKFLPSLLLSNWQEMLDKHSFSIDLDVKSSQQTCESQNFHIWKQIFSRTCSAIDKELEHHPRIDSSDSGTTALTIVRQDDLLTVANVGDSRAVLATISEDGNLVPVQLTVDLKPNLPEEAERIKRSRGRVICSRDEPGVYRVWPPNNGPGLALSRALGDHSLKKYGVISEPQVTQRRINVKDQFVILATDGVWDVISNEAAVQIVSSAPTREQSAKRLVKYAAHAWNRKRPGIAMDDISAICMYLHGSSPPYKCQLV
ncbi:hypothetical protein RND81_12G137000 [Saponaria officinalis]|uniref:PPM-type phosphatase domain-containing protein n=1 Tax=Saponaria officinalis TaxID=3572 RepID=A0AAW1HA85_SAPOF